jgi:peptidoglycan/xylan/chitin deacetylase (PgdA/CDA1 family)
MPVRSTRSGTLFDAILSRGPTQAAFARRAERRLTVLAYHDISHPEQFESHLREICRICTPIDADTAISLVRDRAPLPPRPVLITFDDGDPSLLEPGATLLARFELPAVAFVNPVLVGTTDGQWWQQVEELVRRRPEANGSALGSDRIVSSLKAVPDGERRASIVAARASSPPLPRRTQLSAADLRRLESAGVEIGNHTLSHPILPMCDRETLTIEIETAHEALHDALGHAPRLFAYPNGDYDPRCRSLLDHLGYDLAFLFDHAQSDPRAVDPYRVSRLRVNSDTPLERLRSMLSGLHPAVHRARLGLHGLGHPVRTRAG